MQTGVLVFRNAWFVNLGGSHQWEKSLALCLVCVACHSSLKRDAAFLIS